MSITPYDLSTPAFQRGFTVLAKLLANDASARRGLVDAAEVGLRSDAHELHMYRTGLVMRDDMERARAGRWDRSDAE